MLRRSSTRSALAGSLIAIGPALGLSGATALADAMNPAAPVCQDVRIPLDVSIGETPIASLTVGGGRGAFLIDSGASSSAVDAKSYGLAAGARVEMDIQLCGSARSVFGAEEMGSYQAPAGGQRGRIGTDILDRLALAFSYGDPSPSMTARSQSFDPAALAASGLIEIDRPGYYGGSTEPRLPDSNDVPVLGLAIGPVTVAAQLDTGFDDADDPGVVQGNAALLAALQKKGVAMHPAPAGHTLGCAGVSPYPRWQIDSSELAVVATDGTTAKTYRPPLLEIKDDVACGGIASFSAPFAQIGASWLGRWRTTILDGPAGKVWINR